VMLGRERERVVDAIGVAGNRHDGAPWQENGEHAGSIT